MVTNTPGDGGLNGTVGACRRLAAPIRGRALGDSYREPLALWTLTALPSGSRKTAVINELTAPLVDWEKRERDRLRPEIGRRHAATEIAKKRIEKLKLDAAKADTGELRQRIQIEVERELSEMPAELFAPRLFTSDVTGERLQQLLFEQDERMAVLTDEAGIFQIMGGQYSGGSASLDVFLQGHAGTSLRVDRAGRLAHIDRPALSFGMALQPGILQDVAKSRRFRDSGLLARYLYAIPSSNVGLRDVRARWSIPGSVKDAWYQNINTLLADVPRPIGTPRALSFSLEAREVWLQLSEHVERNQGPGSKWEHMSDWTAKLPGATARIATLLELAINGVSASNVSVDSAERAVKLAYLLAEHAEAAFRLMGAADVESDALVLLGWIQKNRFCEFTRREAQKGLESRFRTVPRLLAAVGQLQDWFVLSNERKRASEGGRPSVYYAVNPHTFVDKSELSH